MKLHLPKLLLTAVLAACSMSEAAMTTPVAGTEGCIWTWNGSQWTRDSDNSVSSPSRQGDTGAFMIVNNDLFQTTNAGNTSDGGGIKVADGVTVRAMNLGTWAGTIQVGAGARLITSANWLKNMATNAANVWVDGELTITNLAKFDNGATAVDQNWHIGQDGFVNLYNTSSLAYNGKKWNIELVVNKAADAEIEGLSNRSRTNYTEKRTFIATRGDIYDGNLCTLTVIDAAGNTLSQDSDYSFSHDASGFAVSYDVFGYEQKSLTWNGDSNAVWVNTGDAWKDSNGITTSFLNGDSVTFDVLTTGISNAVSISGNVTTESVTILDSYIFTSEDAGVLSTNAISIGDSGSLQIDKNVTVSYGGSSDLGYLSKTTGTGVIDLNAAITRHNDNLNTSFSGVLNVAKGQELYLGNNQGRTYDLSNATIQLNEGSYFEMQGQNSLLGTLNAVGSSVVKFEDGDSGIPLLTIGQVNIAKDKTLTVQNNWEGIFTIQNLNAEGELYVDMNGNMSTVIQTISHSGSITNNNSNHTLSLGVNSSSVLNLGGDITNNGTLNISGVLSGQSAISGGTINLGSETSISGNISFNTDIKITDTLVSTGSVTLEGNVYIDTVSNLLQSSGGVIYSNNEGKDGYITSAIFYVVKGEGDSATSNVTGTSTLYEGSTSMGSIVQSSDGKSLVIGINNENANTGVYYVNTQDLTVDGTETNVAVNATGYFIAKDRTLTLRKNQNTTTMTASKILAEATGEGNITVDVDFTYQGQSKATGTLTINQGKTLKVGTGSNGTSNISSFSAVKLSGGTLDLNGKGQEIQSLTVDTAASVLSPRNVSASHQTFTLSGTTTLKTDLAINPFDNEHADVVIKDLTGKGNLSIQNGGWGAVVARIEKLTNYTGAISVDSEGRTSDINFVEFGKADTDAAFSTLKGLSLSNNAYATIYAKGDSTIENLTLTNGAKLNYITNYSANEYTLSKVVVSGEGNFINFAADDKYYQGCLEIDNLTNARKEDGEAIAGAITISGNARTTNRDVVNLNGGDFVGTITYKGATNDGTNRKHALNIKSATAAANAVINLEALSGNVVALGLGADTVNVKGITGSNATIYSGEQEYGNGNAFASDTQKSRTLAINTAGVSYENSVAVAANVNLEKRGAGKQTFSGDMSDFNGSLKVIEGELAFTAAEALKVNGLYVGPEKNTAAPAASEGANVGILTVANGIAASGAVTLVGGAVINGNLDLRTATDVSFDVTPTPGTGITLNGALTMSSTEAFVTALGDSLAGLTAGEMLTVFTGVSSFTVGGVTYSAESENQLAGVDLSTWSSDVAVGQYTMTYDTSANVGSIVITVGEVIPEPTTATLSLLALMGLAARRRRK